MQQANLRVKHYDRHITTWSTN